MSCVTARPAQEEVGVRERDDVQPRQQVLLAAAVRVVATCGLLRGWLATPSCSWCGWSWPSRATGSRRSPRSSRGSPGCSSTWWSSTLIASIDGVLLRALREHPAERYAGVRASLALLMDALLDETSAPDPGAPV